MQCALTICLCAVAVLHQPCRDVLVIFGVFMLEQAQRVLKDIFGYDSFRGRQGAIIERVASGGDALVLMPTGGGKSLCFQVPALLREGLAVVVSPLIALMDDQVATLEELGVAAASLNSTLSAEQQRDLAARIKRGEVKMLYLAPERLVQPRMLAFLQSLEIALFAIDEAHCVSQWGHDFRREYLQLGQLAELFPHVPRIALTATADKRTREEIVERLHLDFAQRYAAGESARAIKSDPRFIETREHVLAKVFSQRSAATRQERA